MVVEEVVDEEVGVVDELVVPVPVPVPVPVAVVELDDDVEVVEELLLELLELLAPEWPGCRLDAECFDRTAP